MEKMKKNPSGEIGLEMRTELLQQLRNISRKERRKTHTLCGGVNFSSSTKAWNTEEGKKGAL